MRNEIMGREHDRNVSISGSLFFETVVSVDHIQIDLKQAVGQRTRGFHERLEPVADIIFGGIDGKGA